MPTLTFRPLTRADLPATHALLTATGQADGVPLRETLTDLETQFDDPWSDPALHTRAAFTADGQLLGFARTFMNPTPSDAARAIFDLEMHPAHRGNAADDQLLDWAEAQCRERALAGPPDMPRSVRHHCQTTQTEYIARMAQRGFAPVRYFYRMRRDLSQPIPEVTLPKGLTLRPYTPDMNRAMMQAFNESFLDHWSFEPITEKDWEMFFIQRDGFRPDLSFVVMDGNEMAAFSFNVVNTEENKLAGMEAGWVQDLGTRRPWRKRGLATALLCQSMRAFQAAGLQHALLGVDSENPTGALGVYERVGFAPYKRFMALEKSIA